MVFLTVIGRNYKILGLVIKIYYRKIMKRHRTDALGLPCNLT